MPDAGIELKRVVDLVTQSDVDSGVYTLIDSVSGAVKKYPLGSFIASVAPIFDATAAYSAGDYCNYNGQIYRFTADHAAGSWTGSDATAADIGAELSNLKQEISKVNDKCDATVTWWNLLAWGKILEKTYDNSGTQSTNSTYYTAYIPCAAGEVYYAYSVYSHTSSAYNHKVRKVNFYNGDTFISALEYVNTWITPANTTRFTVSMCYIGNDYANGRSSDDFITVFTDGNRINRLNSDIHADNWNAIKNNEVIANTYINTSGTQISSNSFYTIKNIPVKQGQVWYGFNEYLSSLRFVTFYNSSGTAIGGFQYIKSWIIPENAVLMSMSANYTNGAISPRDYVTSELFEIIQELQNEDKHYGNRETRIATINFQFDDGNAKDAEIFDIFNNNGVPCGFALISNISTSRVPEYLMYQRNGFEILSHSTDGSGMSSSSLDPSTIDTKLKTSKKTLEGYGFNIRGWVTPYSEMNETFIPLMERYYDFGTTVYYGAYDGTGTPYMTKSSDTSKVFRVSLQSTTLDNQKAAVDAAIQNNGFLTFYGHSADLDGTDYETTSNLNSLLSYINSKKADLRCMVLKPSDAVDYYFHVRHSDYVDLLS